MRTDQGALAPALDAPLADADPLSAGKSERRRVTRDGLRYILGALAQGGPGFIVLRFAAVLALALVLSAVTSPHAGRGEHIMTTAASPHPATPALSGKTTTTSTTTPASAAVPAAITGSASAVTTGFGPVGVPGQWKVIFDDEFNGSTLDTSKWSKGWFGSGVTKAPNGIEQNCEDPDDVSEAGGSLTISAIAHPESCGGLRQPYASGLISTNGKFQFSYGAFEARIWVPGAGSKIADWPQFWSNGQRWPADGEIDALEGLGGRACYHFHRSGGGPGGCTTVAGAARGWHTYAVDWERGSITFYYDGRRVWKTTTGVTSAPMYLVLNLGVSNIISRPDIAPATMHVDYVRVWQHSS